MASDINLTGVWKGRYSYPRLLEPVDFTATLIDTGNYLTGTTHEPAGAVRSTGSTALGLVEGSRDGRDVTFVKRYENTPENHSVTYVGLLNGYATEIRGRWMIFGVWSGDFVMTRNRITTKAMRRKVGVGIDR